MLEIYPIHPPCADAAAHAAGRSLASGWKTHGRATLVATGGRSPGQVYDRLGEAPVDWARAVVTLSDERCVPPDAADSNARLLHERLFKGPPAKAAFVPLWRDGDDPETAARNVEPALRAMIPFDVVLLGMGEDGHVASLIPGMPGLAEAMNPDSSRLAAVAAAGFGSPPLARITLTLAALLQARSILLLVAGDAKRAVIDAALAGAELPVRALLVQDRVPVRVFWAPSHKD